MYNRKCPHRHRNNMPRLCNTTTRGVRTGQGTATAMATLTDTMATTVATVRARGAVNIILRTALMAVALGITEDTISNIPMPLATRFRGTTMMICGEQTFTQAYRDIARKAPGRRYVAFCAQSRRVASAQSPVEDSSSFERIKFSYLYIIFCGIAIRGGREGIFRSGLFLAYHYCIHAKTGRGGGHRGDRSAQLLLFFLLFPVC